MRLLDNLTNCFAITVSEKLNRIKHVRIDRFIPQTKLLYRYIMVGNVKR